MSIHQWCLVNIFSVLMSKIYYQYIQVDPLPDHAHWYRIAWCSSYQTTTRGLVYGLDRELCRTISRWDVAPGKGFLIFIDNIKLGSILTLYFYPSRDAKSLKRVVTVSLPNARQHMWLSRLQWGSLKIPQCSFSIGLKLGPFSGNGKVSVGVRNSPMGQQQ